jgi:dTDP-4-dehydrorhamnose 3,5-epimerase
MEILETTFPGLILIKPDVYADSRGYFFESFNQERFQFHGIISGFVQDNESMSSKGVIRGLHYQLEPFAQAKLVRVVQGEVFDVAVDLRKGSPTFGKWFGTELSAENKLQMLVPKGFAHGFSVLSPTVLFSYKCDKVYNRQMERTIRFDDPFLGIDWKLPEDEWSISDKDKLATDFLHAEMNFTFP